LCRARADNRATEIARAAGPAHGGAWPNPRPPITFPEAHQVVIVCGETGSGKTTQLPKIALNSGRGLGAGGRG
jgi:ATP-dependent helicase HrpA